MQTTCKALFVLGILLLVYALVGRFISTTGVLGFIIPGSIKASSMMIAANSLLLIGIATSMTNKRQ